MGGSNGKGAVSPAATSGPACSWPPWEDSAAQATAVSDQAFGPFAPPPSCERPVSEDVFTTEEPSFTSILNRMSALPAVQRAECIGRRFLGLPSIDDPLGEGDNDTIDPDPMFRFDGLDCMTYVEEVLALSRSRSAPEFIRRLQEIRYRDGVPLYGWRNHFVEADWIRENTRRGYIADITAQVGGELTRQVSAVIDRARWVDQKPIGEKQKVVIRNQLMGAGLSSPETATMDYIPLGAFFVIGEQGTEANWDLINRMPEISVLLMIRHEIDARRVGVVVAHMAFLIVPRMEDGTPLEPIIRHASSKGGAFKDEALLDYLSSQAPYRAGVSILAIE